MMVYGWALVIALYVVIVLLRLNSHEIRCLDIIGVSLN